MSEAPKIQHDFEFTFPNGLIEHVVAIEGRDVMELPQGEDQGYKFAIHHEDGVLEHMDIHGPFVIVKHVVRTILEPPQPYDARVTH